MVISFLHDTKRMRELIDTAIERYERAVEQSKTLHEHVASFRYSFLDRCSSAAEYQAELEQDLADFIAAEPEKREKLRVKVAGYYDSWEVNYLWWQENWPKARRCHRNCVCDLWEENKRREPVAKAIANGNYSLHKEQDEE